MNKTNRNFFLAVLLAAIVGAAVASAGYYYFYPNGATSVRQIQNPGNQYAAQIKNVSNVDASPAGVDFTSAAELTTPGVVHIKTYVSSGSASAHGGSPYDEFFKDFFHNRSPQRQPQNDTPQRAGSGSGVILSQDGFIATNNHVIENADKIEVVLNDRRRYEAELVGTDPTTDLALLKISEENLRAIKYGNSDQVSIGEWVLAVGNPFNLTSTVTAGIVSAKARNINILHDRENLAIESFIQTDAAVNPGNSGGALVNLKGELIGINSAIATPTGSYAGYSFAIPVNLVKKVMTDLAEYGQVQRALLGVSITDVTAELAEEKDLKNVKGVYIAGVRENSAAEEADLEEGDVVLSVDETSVNTSSELQEAIALYRPGDKVTIKYRRDGNLRTAEVTLKNKMGTTEIVESEDKMIISALGAKMRELKDEEMKEFDIEFGVKIQSIDDGKLKSAGIPKGFIITHVDRKPVRTPEELVRILQGKKGGILIEGLTEGGERQYYAIGW